MKLISAFVLTTILSITAGVFITHAASGRQAENNAVEQDPSRSMFDYYVTVDDVSEAWVNCSWTALDCR